MSGLVLFTIVLVCFSVYKYVCKRKATAPEPPMFPGAWPIVGHMPLMYGAAKALAETYDHIVEEGLKSNTCHYKFKILHVVCYAIADPEDCLTVANTCLEKEYYFQRILKPWLGDGLVTVNANTWKHHRKLLNKSFNQQILDGFLHVFNTQSRLGVKKLERYVGTGPFDHKHIVNETSLDTLYLTMMGLENSEHYDDLKKEYFQSMYEMYKVVSNRFLKLWPINDFLFNRSNMKKKMDECLKVISQLPKMVTAIKKRERKNIEINSNLEHPKTKNFIDLVITLWESGEMSEKEAIDNINTMVVAGFDTIAVTLCTILVVLGSYPDVQEKICQELQEVMGSSDMDVEKHHLGQMKYLEAVIKEVLRLYTTAPLVLRNLNQDVHLTILGLKALHRHPIWGPDCNIFRPERWLERNVCTENTHIFGAFGIGRRNCIGTNYAMMNMKTFLAHVVRSYRITADITKTKYELVMLLKPYTGFYITVEKRE